MKTPIVIQGIKYTSVAEAARTLVISKSALYRAIKNKENLDRFSRRYFSSAGKVRFKICAFFSSNSSEEIIPSSFNSYNFLI